LTGSQYCERHNVMRLQPKTTTRRRLCEFPSCRKNRRSGSNYCQRHKHTEDIAVAKPDESRTCPAAEATPEEEVVPMAHRATAAVKVPHPIAYKTKYVPRDTSRKSLVREDGPLGKLNLNKPRELKDAKKLYQVATRMYTPIRQLSTFPETDMRGRIDLDPWMNMTKDEWKMYGNTISKRDVKSLSDLVQKVTEYVLQDVGSTFSGFENLSKASNLVYLIAFPKPNIPDPLLHKGKNRVHRDIDSTTAPRITVELLLDNISKDSGSVVFWPNTIQYPCDSKHSGRYVETAHEKKNVKYLHELGGKAGDVIYWDSRLLHNSIANVTDKETTKLLWYIVP
jgi:hypothetical protein